MLDFLHFDLVSIIKTYGYLGLFLIIFAESGVLIGFFLPGDSLLFTAGFLASQGFLNVWILIPLLFIAAFAGDSVGYYFGHRTGPKVFIKEKSFWFNPEHVVKTRNFFEAHGSKALVLARFMPVIRTFIPIMAGVGEMKYRTFIMYNGIGALLWACGMTLFGYIFGNAVPNADHYVLEVVVLIIITSFIPPVVSYLRSRNK